jgi:Trk K+ transport system NAD-binding subunit
MVGHLDLVALLNSGLTFSIPAKRELNVAVLRTESSLVGRKVQSFYEMAGDNPLEIVAVLRDRDAILPKPDTVLQEK